MKKLILILPLLLCGCGTWNKPGGTAEQFYMDRGQCNAQAFSASGGGDFQQPIIFNSCMQGKGWHLE
jgi:hypothetical protein